jgi:HEAT repeat protein
MKAFAKANNPAAARRGATALYAVGRKKGDVDMGISGLFKPSVEKMKAKEDVEGLVKALKYTKDCTVRRGAAEALGEIRDSGAVDPLIQASRDEDSGVRWRAAVALGHVGSARAVYALAQALKDQERDVRLCAAEALGEIRDAGALGPLIQALRDEDSGVRCKAAVVLGHMGDARAVHPLAQALKDQDKDVRSCAAKALGEIGNERAVEPLTQALGDRLYAVREEAVRALANIGEPALDSLIGALKHEDRGTRRAAAEALGELGGQRAAEALAEALKYTGWEHYIVAVLDALEKLGDAAIKPLIQALKDAHARGNAAWVLTKLGWEPRNDAEKVDYLVATEKWAELMTYGEVGLEAVLQALHHSSHFVRCNVVDALADWASSEMRDAVVEALIQALEDEDWRVRHGAVNALGKIRLVEPLIQALNDEDHSVRCSAARLLGEIGDKRAIEPLNRALHDKSEFVREQAGEALLKLRG